MNQNISNLDDRKLLTLKEYVGLLLPININDDYIEINNFGAITDNSHEYFAVEVGGNLFRLLPGPEFGPRLYRGQNYFYENCRASLYRIKSYNQYVLNKIKHFEFFKLICTHPILRWFSNFKKCGLMFSIDFEGLAQHYELETKMLDFTRSKDIAMFFALSHKNDTTNSYEPILDETREVVLYTLDIAEMIKSGDILNIIGFQPLLRPYKQKAFSIKQNFNENLNDKKYVSCHKFKVDKSQAIKYYEMFEGGRSLFPKDPIDEKVSAIRISRTIDREVIEYMFKRNNIFSDKIKSEKDLLQLCKNVEITDKTQELTFSQEEISLILNNWRPVEKALMTNIKFRLVADPLY